MNFVLSSIETTIGLVKSLDCDCIFFLIDRTLL